MQDVAIGIHALTAVGKKQTNVSTFATSFQSAAQKLRESEPFSAVTRLGHNVIAHNAVRSKRSAVNEANKTVNVVNTTADDVHQNASHVRIVYQTLMMTVCQPSSRQHLFAKKCIFVKSFPLQSKIDKLIEVVALVTYF